MNVSFSIVNLDLVFFTSVIGLSFLLWLWFRQKFQFWKIRNVKQVSPLFSIKNLLRIISSGTRQNVILFLKDLYLTNRNEPFVGFYVFYNPALLVIDSEVMKHVMVKDADHFNSHGINVDHGSNPLALNLFTLEGSEWKQMRSKLSNSFTAGKTKMMYSSILKVAKDMSDYIEPLAMGSKDVDFKDVLARYTINVIGKCAFGLDCNNFKDPNSEFMRTGARIFECNSILRELKELAAVAIPGIIKFFKIKVNDPILEKFFTDLVQSSVNYRETNNIQRNDLLDLLIRLKNDTVTDDKGNIIESSGINLKQITAQVFIFFSAGFETSATTASFTLYEMALNLDLQAKLRQEILEVLEQHGGECTYEAVQNMTYLDCVIKEALRMYPPAGSMIRRCIKKYTVPNQNLTIEKGTLVFISPAALHNDDRYFPEPEKYDPDRFSPENKATIPNNVYIPFGAGPRYCIAERFGFMQTRLGVIHIISKFEVSVCERTHVPMEYTSHGLVTSPRDGMWLKLTKI